MLTNFAKTIGSTYVHAFNGGLIEDRDHAVGRDRRASSFASIVRAAIGRLRTSQGQRSTVRDLAAMDDHLLRDIGIPRSEIRTVATAVARNGRIAANDNNARIAA